MTLTAFEIKVRKYVSLATGIISNHVIPGKDNAPRPTEAYASVLLITQKKQGLSAVNYQVKDEETATESVCTSLLCTFSVQIYNTPEAFALAERLTIYHQLSEGQYYLAQQGFIVHNTSMVRDMAAVQSDGNYQERAAVDITFGILIGAAQAVNLLKSMELQLQADSTGTETAHIDLTGKKVKPGYM